MGIRINKAIGYGLIVNYDDIDDIVNTKFTSVSLAQYPEYLQKLSEEDVEAGKEGYVSNDTALELALFRESGYVTDLGNAVGRDTVKVIDCEYEAHYEDYQEGEFPDFQTMILVIPVAEKDTWHRHDNAIDYAEASVNNEDMEPVFQFLDNGFFPWDGVFVNKKTQQLLKSNDRDYIQFITEQVNLEPNPEEYSEERMKTVEKIMRLREERLQKNGFDSYADYVENVVPLVPDAIRHTIRYLDLFRHQNTITELRPVIAKWWE